MEWLMLKRPGRRARSIVILASRAMRADGEPWHVYVFPQRGKDLAELPRHYLTPFEREHYVFAPGQQKRSA